jgi:plasmid stabilization system protein ParE
MDGGAKGGVAAARRRAVSDFVLSDEARSDLWEVWGYVARHNPSAADKLERDVLKGCALLARQPDIGHRRRDLCDDASVRFHAVRTWYLIVYEIHTEPLRIVRILHGARDVAGELTDE